jgi:hypothetical protein
LGKLADKPVPFVGRQLVEEIAERLALAGPQQNPQHPATAGGESDESCVHAFFLLRVVAKSRETTSILRV